MPSSVIKGMLAGIGVTLILKQVPHAVGYDADAEGDMSFVEASGQTTLSTLAESLQQIQPAAVLAALLGVAVMLWWPRLPVARLRPGPAPMNAGGLGVALNEMLPRLLPGPVSYTPLRAHENGLELGCRLLLEQKKKKQHHKN